MAHDTTDSERKHKRHADTAKIKIKGSWTAIPNKLLKEKRLSRDARLLCSMMFMHAGNSEKAFPSQEDLADELSHFVEAEEADPETGETRIVIVERKITVRTVQRWLTELRAMGWVAWRQTLKNNEYTLFDPTERATSENNDESDSSLNDALTGATAVSSRATQGSHGDATQGSPRATAVSPSKTIEGSPRATEGSGQATEGSPSLIPLSRSTMLESDSLDSDSYNKDSSSSDTMPTHHPDDDDDLVVAFLREAGVTTAQEFRGLDLAAVQERVTMLQRDPNCRPGAIVKSLRASPPRPRPTMGSPGYIAQLNAKYGDLFRSGSDVSGLLPEDQELHVGEEQSPTARPRKPDRV